MAVKLAEATTLQKVCSEHGAQIDVEGVGREDAATGLVALFQRSITAVTMGGRSVVAGPDQRVYRMPGKPSSIVTQSMMTVFGHSAGRIADNDPRAVNDKDIGYVRLCADAVNTIARDNDSLAALENFKVITDQHKGRNPNDIPFEERAPVLAERRFSQDAFIFQRQLFAEFGGSKTELGTRFNALTGVLNDVLSRAKVNPAYAANVRETMFKNLYANKQNLTPDGFTVLVGEVATATTFQRLQQIANAAGRTASGKGGVTASASGANGGTGGGAKS